ncbi:MAG: hypothetical protein DRI34_13505 [Deltaproteobacteria bacterium]|nr:MAG: hypothetical protein DRI34_13505 [Deltaproteobacteria bacterium]
MVDLYAVCGRPVAHSRSPQMFNAAFAAAGVPARYLRLGAVDADGAWRAFQSLDLRAMNVTSPFKQALLAPAGRVDAAARSIGATNCLVRDDHGSLAHNTDWQGVCGALRQAGIDPAGKRCLVLGAGGAARAAVYGLLRAGARVMINNRTPARARRLAAEFGCQFADGERLPAELEQAAVVVSCLPDGVDIGAGRHLRPGQAVLEAAYRQPVLQQAAERAGAIYLSGLEWLLQQALVAHEIFLGRPAPARLMHRALQHRRAAAANSIVLVGFMGAGKSLLGRMLAERLGFSFVDTDELVCRTAGSSIEEIFKNGGEDCFRRLERQAVEMTCELGQTVVACGGGAVLSRRNRELLRRARLAVWLWVDGEEARRRAAGRGRPLLGPDRTSRDVIRLLQERRQHYCEVADLVVDTSTLDPAAAVEVLHDEVRVALAG